MMFYPANANLIVSLILYLNLKSLKSCKMVTTLFQLQIIQSAVNSPELEGISKIVETGNFPHIFTNGVYQSRRKSRF